MFGSAECPRDDNFCRLVASVPPFPDTWKDHIFPWLLIGSGVDSLLCPRLIMATAAAAFVWFLCPVEFW